MRLNLEALFPKEIRVRLVKEGNRSRIDDMHGRTIAYDLDFGMSVEFLEGTIFFKEQSIIFQSEPVTGHVQIRDYNMAHLLDTGSLFTFTLMVGENV